MSFLNYEYKMIISYSEPVDKCYFTIKAIPADDFRQKNISYDIGLEPEVGYSMSKDSFGNVQIIGSEPMPHSQFVFTIKGLVETYPINISEGVKKSIVGMYKYPHGRCIPKEALTGYKKEIEPLVLACPTDREKCMKIMELLSGRMTYKKGSTDVNTSAEEAFVLGEGVCQDYAHIYICLLRMFGIPARYVCGLIVGEGESHAWVEAACDGNYVAFDPTNNKVVTDDYIKLGCGRDATDSAINRGVMWGGGAQTQEIKVSVEKYC